MFVINCRAIARLNFCPVCRAAQHLMAHPMCAAPPQVSCWTDRKLRNVRVRTCVNNNNRLENFAYLCTRAAHTYE